MVDATAPTIAIFLGLVRWAKSAIGPRVKILINLFAANNTPTQKIVIPNAAALTGNTTYISASPRIAKDMTPADNKVGPIPYTGFLLFAAKVKP